MSNRQVLEKFFREREANDISLGTRGLDAVILRKLDGFLGKPFKEATKEDMLRFFEVVREGHKPSYIHTIKKKVKVFYNWLYELDPRTYPDCVRWIHSNNPRHQTKSGGLKLPIKPQDILTEQEILRLVNAATHPRDQCLIILTYETAGRAAEVLKLRIGSVNLLEKVPHITLEGATGARQLVIVDSVPYIQTWLNVHPQKHDSTAYLFPPTKGRNKNESMGYHNFLKLCYKLRKDAKITKPVRPHLLRHARLTELAKSQYFNDAALKTYAGWTQGSRMTGIYVHLSGKDLDDAILRMHGRTMPEKPEPSPLTPKTCVRGHENESTAAFCKTCGIILDQDKLLEWQTQEAERSLENKNLKAKLEEQDKTIEELGSQLEARLEARLKKLEEDFQIDKRQYRQTIDNKFEWIKETRPEDWPKILEYQREYIKNLEQIRDLGYQIGYKGQDENELRKNILKQVQALDQLKIKAMKEDREEKRKAKEAGKPTRRKEVA